MPDCLPRIASLTAGPPCSPVPLPAEPRNDAMGGGGIEPPTSCLSGNPGRSLRVATSARAAEPSHFRAS
jgi:hypothetical protein